MERASTPKERRILASLQEVAEGKVAVEAPALWILGEVVRVFAEAKAPLEALALGG